MKSFICWYLLDLLNCILPCENCMIFYAASMLDPRTFENHKRERRLKEAISFRANRLKTSCQMSKKFDFALWLNRELATVWKRPKRKAVARTSHIAPRFTPVSSFSVSPSPLRCPLLSRSFDACCNLVSTRLCASAAGLGGYVSMKTNTWLYTCSWVGQAYSVDLLRTWNNLTPRLRSTHDFHSMKIACSLVVAGRWGPL